MSEVKVNKISPRTGTATTIGDSGDTFTVPSGANLVVAGTLNPSGTITAGSIAGTAIADNAIDSDHYTDGSIDTAHIANDQITAALIADNAIDSDMYVDGSIDTAHLGALQVTGAKLNTDVISAQTELASAPADTDEFMVSDAGVLKRIDYSLIKTANTPAVLVTNSGNQSIATATNTLVTFDTETIDTDSAFASNVFTVPSGEDGMYFISFRGSMQGIDAGEFIQLRIYLNGSASAFFESRMTAYTTDVEFKFSSSGALNLSAGDTISYAVYQNSGDSQDLTTAGLYIFKLIGA